MKKRLFTLSLAVLLFAGALSGILVSIGASTETEFDPDSYDYEALYAEGAMLHFSAMDHKAGDTVDPILSATEDGKQLLLEKINGSIQTEWTYGNGYLEISTGSVINGRDLLKPVSQAGNSQNYTVEYLFGTVDKGLPQTATDFSSEYRSNAFAYSSQVYSHTVGSWTFGTYYITDEGLSTLKKQAIDYQRAGKDAALQASYTFKPNSAHVGADADGIFDYAQTKELITSYGNFYAFLNYDFTNVAGSRISKTVAKVSNPVVWGGDFDWRGDDLELFRMPWEDVRQLNFLLNTSLDAAGTQYTEQISLYKDSSLLKTMKASFASAPLDDLVLAKDVGTRVYAIRVYDRALSEEETKQNHRADVFRFYRLDPAFYFEASEAHRALYNNVLDAVKVGVDSKEQLLAGIEKATSTILMTKKNEYTSLYVQDGLLLMIDPMAAKGFKEGDTVSAVSDLAGNLYSVGSVSRPASYTSDRAVNLGLLQSLNLGNVLPTEGEYTVRILYANHFGEEHGSSSNQAKKFTIGPADFRVNYEPPSVDASAKGGVTKGYLFITNGQTGKIDWKNDFDITWDGGQKQADLFAVDYGQMTDFTNEIVLGTKNVVRIYRDGVFVLENSHTGGALTPNALIVGPSSNTDVYAVMVYSGVLTEEQKMQNHFADLMAYYQVDMTMFDKITSDNVKALLYTALADIKIGETSQEYLQNVLESFALTGGSLGVIKAEDYLTFEGIQSRIEDYASARALFSFNNQKIAELEKLGAEVEVGAILMPVTDESRFDDLEVAYLPSIGEYQKVRDGIIQQTFYRKGELFEGLYGFADDEKRYFSAMIPALDPSADAEKLNQQYYMRAYVAVNMGNSNFVLYSDAKSDLFGESVSVIEACDHFLFTGYAKSEVLAKIAGEYAAAAAEKTIDLALTAHGNYNAAELASRLIQSARDGALEAKKLNEKASAGIAIDMKKTDAMRVAPQAATTKVQAELYATIGIAKYEEALEAVKLARAAAEQMSETVYAEAMAAGADEATAQKVQDTACTKLLSMIGDVEDYLSTSEPLVKEMQTIVNSFENYTALLQLSKVFPSKASLFINKLTVTRYTIVTDTAHLAIAEELQKLLLAHVGNTVGVYNIDNKYVGSHYDYTTLNTIILGLTEQELGDGDYAVYGDGNCIYIEGKTLETVKVATAKFFKTYCAGTGRQQVTLGRDTGALLKQVYTPIISFNYGESYPAVRCDSYDAEGIWQVFLQKMQGLPDEITVIDPVLPEAIPDSAKNVYYVAQDGDDANSGAIDTPLKTLEAALEKVAYTGGGTIYLRGGYYQLEKTVTVTEQHSGSLTAPLYISAYPGEKVIFTSAKQISASSLQTVDQAVASNMIAEKMKTRLNRFSSDNSQNVYVTYLDPAVYDYGTPATTQLYIDGALSHTARYPNKGANDEANGIANGRIKFTDKGIKGYDLGQEDVLKVGAVSTSASSLYDAHKNEKGGWQIVFDNCLYKDHLLAYDKDVKLYTYAAVYEEWHRAHYTLTLSKDSSGRNIMTSAEACQWGCMEKAGNNMYFYNAIEDLDANGEFYIDHETGMLYIYSDTSLDGKEILLSASATTLLEVANASNVVVNGITFTKTMATAVVIRNTTERVIIQNCTFSDIKGSGATLSGRYCGMINNDMSNTTGNMINVSGVINRLESSYNFIQNNHFHHPNELAQQAISLSGVGAVVSHNLFDDTVIYYGASLETILEYNEFNRGSQITYDSGPVYISGASAKRANHVRYNYIHDLNFSRYGIYLDDLSSGNFVYGNIVHYAEENSGGAKCINLHNGIMNVVYNNVGINADTAGILNNLNYFVKSIDGKATGGGGLAYRWEGLSADYFRYKVEREAYEPRFPIHVWHNDLMEQHIAERELNPGWSDTADKNSVADELEIFLRSPSMNVYLDNVMIKCGSDGYAFADVLENCKIERNLYYKTVEEVGFADYANRDFHFRADSPVFRDNPEFFELPLSRMGRIADLAE